MAQICSDPSWSKTHLSWSGKWESLCWSLFFFSRKTNKKNASVSLLNRGGDHADKTNEVSEWMISHRSQRVLRNANHATHKRKCRCGRISCVGKVHRKGQHCFAGSKMKRPSKFNRHRGVKCWFDFCFWLGSHLTRQPSSEKGWQRRRNKRLKLSCAETGLVVLSVEHRLSKSINQSKKLSSVRFFLQPKGFRQISFTQWQTFPFSRLSSSSRQDRKEQMTSISIGQLRFLKTFPASSWKSQNVPLGTKGSSWFTAALGVNNI